MRAFFTAILLTLAVYLPSVQAQGPEADYANIYALVLQGDTLNAKGDWRTAHARYAEAQAALKNLRADNPDWNLKAVKYRAKYLAEKLAETAAPPAADAGAPAGESPSAAPAQTGEPVEMKLKWELGKRYEQLIETSQASAMSLPGSPQPIQQEVKQTQDVSLTVLKETDGGGRELEMEIQGMTLSTKAGGRNVLDFDSKKPDDAANPATPLLRKMVGMLVKFLTDAAGKIQSVEGFQETLDRITAGASAMEQGMIKGMFSEDNFKEMYSAAQGLPDKPVKIGETWPLKLEVALGPLGSVVMNSDYTFKNWEQHNDHKCALLQFTGTLSAADTGSAENAMAIDGGKTSGKLWFDPALGMVVDSVAEEGMTVKVTAQGHSLTTKVNAKVRNKLINISDAKPAAPQ